jgi:5-hydroxyisourate hydrolase
MSPITTHILDTARGCPASEVPVRLERRESETDWREIGAGQTDADGRCKTLMRAGTLSAGTYRISFDTAGYYRGLAEATFYPEVRICFSVEKTDEHYHVPLLLSPFGYSTYRGS